MSAHLREAWGRLVKWASLHPKAELVKVSDLRRWVEFDRMYQYPERVRALADQVAVNGFTDEVIIEVRKTELGLDSKWANVLLTEGNHRVAAAELLGLSYVPARVYATDYSAPTGSGQPWRRVEMKITMRDAWLAENNRPSDVFDISVGSA